MAGPVCGALALLLSTAVPLPPQPAPDRFTVGRVDFLTLAASMPPEESPAAKETEPEPEVPRTLRDLRVRADGFLASDVRSALERARWRLEMARRSAAGDPGGSTYQGNPWGAVLALVIGSVSYTTDRDLRDAKACLAFLEGVDRRARALVADVPETDEPVTPDLLTRWGRLSRELRENTPCRGRR